MDEIEAMREISERLDKLTDEERTRVLTWAAAKYGGLSVPPPAARILEATDKAQKENTFSSAEDGFVPRFASELGVEPERLEAAANPTDSEPYIQLDHKFYEAFKTTPGSKRVAPVVLAATLLLLWNKHVKFGEVTSRDCTRVLSTVDVNDKNPSRGLKNCEWIQPKGSGYKLNPLMIKKAEEFAASYCRSLG